VIERSTSAIAPEYELRLVTRMNELAEAHPR
jgi:hypothetical protein